VFILEVAGDSVAYVTVFEITHETFPNEWWLPFLFFAVIFGVIGTVILMASRGLGAITILLRSFVVLLACVCLVLFAYNLRRRTDDVRAYESGKYKVVEGTVDHYSWRGKTECFGVGGLEFCRGTASRLGWPVGLTREGLAVRIAYLDDGYLRIVRLEVGRSSP
jgi:hypothetical protein